MITVHHLNNSRSQRVLWLLEELGLDYHIKHYKRDTKTNLAPVELKTVHPLGKSPVIEDGDIHVAETGAIVEYLIDTYGKGKMRPERGTEAYRNYIHFLHYSEGSAMLPLLLALYTGYLGEAAAPIMPRVTDEIKRQLDYMEYHLISHDYFAGDEFSGADIMMLFPLEACKARGRLLGYDECLAYVDRMQARPAYLKAIEESEEPYAYGPKT